MRIAVVTGNPKPASRTHGVALAVAATLSAALSGDQEQAHLVVDLSEHAANLFDPSAAELTRLSAEVAAADIAIFASPTYKASYTGLLKAFLDRYGNNGLAGTIAVPVMTGGWAGHLPGRRGSPAARPGRAGRHRAGPRPLRHRARAARAGRRGGQVGHRRDPADPRCPGRARSQRVEANAQSQRDLASSASRADRPR